MIAVLSRIVLVTSLAGLAPQYAVFATNSSTECAVTKPNGQAPLGQPHGSGTYGNDALSTVLFPNGVVEFRPRGPGFVLPDGSLKMKFPWWRKAEATLEISGRRLDASASPLRAEIGSSGDVHMVPTYITFPTTGCWEVTGKVGDVSLVFVTKVVKVGNGPERTAIVGAKSPFTLTGLCFRRTNSASDSASLRQSRRTGV